jgi:uncharacterized protein (DUF1499 family)
VNRLWFAPVGVLLAGAVVLAVSMRWVADDPALWHVDPATAERSGSPNDWLVAPKGATVAVPDRAARVHALPPRELMRRFDAVATSAPRTRLVARSPDGLGATYVQRSRLFGFPDYISVRAIEVPGGSALIAWSRARFGHGDFGVNRARLEAWLAEVDAAT